MSVSGLITLGLKKTPSEIITLGLASGAGGGGGGGGSGGGLVTLGLGLTPSRVLLVGMAPTGSSGTAPSITSQPSNQSVYVGATAIFSVSATGTGLSYQWQLNSGSGFSNIVGATASSYATSAVTLGMSGYLYRCVVTGDTAPPATSNSATLTVSTAPATSVSALAWGIDLRGNFIIIA